MWRALLLLPLATSAQPRTVSDWQTDSALKHAAVSWCVRDAITGSVIASSNSALSVIPASTLKVATTAAALSILGRDYRFETVIARRGEVSADGVLHGDLYIRGAGDPSLGSEAFGDTAVAETWAKAIAESGIKKIDGNIVGDAASFERTIPDNWVWGDIGNYYGAAPCALSYRDNRFSLIFKTGAPGTTATLTAVQPRYVSRDMVISNSVTAHGTEDAAVVYGDPFGWEKRVRGSLPCNKTAFTIEAALPDPALLCAESLRQALADKGIQSRSAASTYTETATGTKAVHVHRSPALHALVAHTNLHSDNLYAESLVRAVGKGNYADGLAMIRNFWKTRGLDITQLFMTDGSGLSRASTVTTDLQSAMLCAIRADSLLFKDIQRSLPAAGVHGSMRSIGKGTFIENNLRAKTGYITRVRAYCGYVTTRKERELAFSVIFNSYNCTPSEARKKIESFLVGLADF